MFRHTESYGVISLHELEGNGVSHVFELAWISVRRGLHKKRKIAPARAYHPSSPTQMLHGINASRYYEGKEISPWLLRKSD